MSRIRFMQHESNIASHTLETTVTAKATRAKFTAIAKLASIGAVLAASACLSATASAQQAPTANGNDAGNASMVKPPQSPASGASAHNPDNMPIKRPDQATNDRMMHAPPPASAAIAK